mgnify:CR=1 FL=1
MGGSGRASASSSASGEFPMRLTWRSWIRALVVLAAGVLLLPMMAWGKPDGESASKESAPASPVKKWVRVISTSAKLLQAPSYYSRVVRTAKLDDEFLVVQRVKTFFLVRDEETESFLFLDQYAAEFVERSAKPSRPRYLRDELMHLGIANVPYPEWDRSPSRGSGRERAYDGWARGKRYPTNYSPNWDYSPRLSGTMLIRSAQKYLGIRYALGGNGKAGIDCSGLTKLAAAAQGLELPRRASLQAEIGSMVAREDLRAGDLVFFRDRKDPGFLSHVGIYVGGGRFLHASSALGRVGYSSLDERYYRSHFAFGRRL